MKNKAFTLIELLVVITIIGILSGIVIVSVQDGIGRARIAGSQRFSHSIRTRLALDMVGRWPFDNNTVDFSGWNNHGTLVTGTAPTPDPCAVRYPTGVTGQALCFDGVDDWVEVGNVLGFEGRAPFTVELWVFDAGFTGFWDRLISKERGAVAPAEGWLLVRINNENMYRFERRQSGTLQGANFSYTPNQWNHLVFTYNGSNIMGYLNGSLVTSPVSTVEIQSHAQPLRIGRISDGGNFFGGRMDEIRIFRAAVPTSYIQKRHVQGIKDLVANGVITQQEKQQRIAELRNSGQLVIDLDAALIGPIDFSPYAHYFEALSLDATE